MQKLYFYWNFEKLFYSKNYLEFRRFGPFSMKKLKKISHSASFLGYKVNISFLAEKLPYSQNLWYKSGYVL